MAVDHVMHIVGKYRVQCMVSIVSVHSKVIPEVDLLASLNGSSS